MIKDCLLKVKPIKIAIASTLLMQVLAFADTDIVYGVDNRVEPYQTTPEIMELTKSTAGMIPNSKVVTIGKYSILPPTSLGNEMNLCPGERFSDQPSAVLCSGFLVGPDLLVTAGHCITTQEECESVSWVFDYKVEEKTNRANVMLDSKKIFKCKKVLEVQLTSTKIADIRDFSLVQLERDVKDREPLTYRRSGKISDGEDIFVVGHPSGLPTKVAGDAQVVENKVDTYFQANLDTFGGNSGSAVFNANTNRIEGILVRGAEDYVKDAALGCTKVNVVQDELKEEDLISLGESVSRITDIVTLKNRFKILYAAFYGQIDELKSYVAKGAYLGIYTDTKQNTLHFAALNDQYETVKYLVANGVDINAKDSEGRTALSIAKVSKNPTLINLLLSLGAKE